MRPAATAIWHFLTTDDGRIKRSNYWYYFAFSIVTAMFLLVLPVVGLPAVMPVVISLILLYPSYCVIAKRLQDFGVAGQWAILITLIAAIDAILIAAGPAGNRPFMLGVVRNLWWWIALINMIAFFVIGLVPGTRGHNTYGPEGN